MYLGENMRRRSFSLGNDLAALSTHGEAVFLSSLRLTPEMRSSEVVAACLTREGDARALFFAGAFLGHDKRPVLVRRAAELGHARAQAWASVLETSPEERREWAAKSARQGDPMGLYELARVKREEENGGRGRREERGGREERREEEKEEGKKDAKEEEYEELLRQAAERGWVRAQIELALLLRDPMERMEWLCRAAPYGAGGRYLAREVARVVTEFDWSGRGAGVVFLAGQTLKGHVHVEDRRAFDDTHKPLRRRELDACVRAVSLYDFWTKNARDSVVVWVLCAKRLNVNKDVRRKISRLVWSGQPHVLTERVPRPPFFPLPQSPFVWAFLVALVLTMVILLETVE